MSDNDRDRERLLRSTFSAETSPADMPVSTPETGSKFDYGASPQPGTGICLSGGGYRAMLFHVGALWRLYESGMLKDVKRISSVSGGSITAAVLGLKWRKLSFQPEAVRDDFRREVVTAIRELADRTIDAHSVLGGIFLPGTIAEKVAGEYRKALFDHATLQDLPDDTAPVGSPGHGPRFVINATNVQSGALWRFSRPYMGDYRVGIVRNPDVELASAVAASSAFPPVLSPLQLKLDPGLVECVEGNDLHEKPYTSRVFLTDGGVYDNLGLETVWKRYDQVFVSDGGGQMAPEAEPKEDWARHAYRVLNLVDNQVRSLRKRQLLLSYKGEGRHRRHGAYWGIRSDILNYGLADAFLVPHNESLELARTATRLKRLPDVSQERLIDWGYAVCDAGIRRHCMPKLSAPDATPYGHFKRKGA